MGGAEEPLPQDDRRRRSSSRSRSTAARFLRDGDVLLWDARGARGGRRADRPARRDDRPSRRARRASHPRSRCAPASSSATRWATSIGRRWSRAAVVYVPLTVDRKVMASVMKTHRFEGIRYEFVPGARGRALPRAARVAPAVRRRGGAGARTRTRVRRDRAETGRATPATGAAPTDPHRCHHSPPAARSAMTGEMTASGAGAALLARHAAVRRFDVSDRRRSRSPAGSNRPSSSGVVPTRRRSAPSRAPRSSRRRRGDGIALHRRASRGGGRRPRRRSSGSTRRCSRASSRARRGRCRCAWAGSSPRWACR